MGVARRSERAIHEVDIYISAGLEFTYRPAMLYNLKTGTERSHNPHRIHVGSYAVMRNRCSSSDTRAPGLVKLGSFAGLAAVPKHHLSKVLFIGVHMRSCGDV